MADVEINESEFARQLGDELRAVADQVFTKSQENIINMGIVNEGILLKTANVIQIDELHYRIVYPAPHAEYIEYGTGPHMPPVNAIERWVVNKLGKTGKEANSIAWAIAKNIAEHGTAPRPYLRPALELVQE